MGRTRWTTGALVLALACQQPSAPEALADLAGVEALAEALRAEGARVEVTEVTTTTLFSVPGRVVVVDGAQIEAFVFAHPTAAAAEIHRLEDSLILWVAPARLYRAGAVLVLYVGRDARAVALLGRVLGPPVAAVGGG